MNFEETKKKLFGDAVVNRPDMLEVLFDHMEERNK